MDSKTREEAINLKIQLLREKSQKIELRHKLVEADKKQAESHGSVIDERRQIGSVNHAGHKQKGSYYRAHMDDPADDMYERERRPKDSRRRDEDRRRRDGQYPDEEHKASDYHYESGGYQDRGRHHRGSQRPRQDQYYDQQRQPDRRAVEREKQRRENIEKMEAQMSGMLQEGDEDWQEPRGYLHDPRREGEGEFARRPPPRNIRYNPNDNRHQRNNRNHPGPRNKMERTIEMTGRERLDYDRWKEQQDRADKERLARSQGESGHWRREWDNQKSNNYEESRDSRGSDYGGRNQGRYNQDRNSGRSNRGPDSKDKYYNMQDYQSWDDDSDWHRQSKETDANEEDEDEWPGLSSDQQMKQDPGRKWNRSDDRSYSSGTGDASYNRNPLTSDYAPSPGRKKSAYNERGDNQYKKPSSRNQPQHHHQSNNYHSDSRHEDQFYNRGGGVRGRGRGRGRGGRYRQDERSGQRTDGRNSGNKTDRKSMSPRNKPNLTVNVNTNEDDPSEKSEVTRTSTSSESDKTVKRQTSLISPLKTPDNFVPVGDWATEVEMSSPTFAPDDAHPIEKRANSADDQPIGSEETMKENDEIAKDDLPLESTSGHHDEERKDSSEHVDEEDHLAKESDVDDDDDSFKTGESGSEDETHDYVDASYEDPHSNISNQQDAFNEDCLVEVQSVIDDVLTNVSKNTEATEKNSSGDSAEVEGELSSNERMLEEDTLKDDEILNREIVEASEMSEEKYPKVEPEELSKDEVQHETLGKEEMTEVSTTEDEVPVEVLLKETPKVPLEDEFSENHSNDAASPSSEKFEPQKDDDTDIEKHHVQVQENTDVAEQQEDIMRNDQESTQVSGEVEREEKNCQTTSEDQEACKNHQSNVERGVLDEQAGAQAENADGNKSSAEGTSLLPPSLVVEEMVSQIAETAVVETN